MHNIMRFIRKQRKKIILGVLILIAVIIAVNMLNYIGGIGYKSNHVKSNIYNESNGTIKSESSAVTGGSVSKSEIKKVNNKIEEFVKFGNSKNIEEAYKLLSEDCKNELYSTIDDFRDYYFTQIFGGEEKKYTIENWLDNTYMVRFTEDLLATGKPVSNSSKLDYITIVEENGEKKLNINKFIGTQALNKSIEEDNIKTEVISRVKYMDYEKYNIKVTNNTGGDILLDQLLDTKKIYLKDTNNIKHYAYSNEIIKNDLIIYQKHSKNIQIKFDNPYIKDRTIKRLTFSEVVLNYDPQNYGNITMKNMSINI